MKTDIDRTKEFLDSLGILYDSYKTSITFGVKRFARQDELCDKVEGYIGFYTRFNFDENGKFLTVGVWE